MTGRDQRTNATWSVNATRIASPHKSAAKISRRVLMRRGPRLPGTAPRDGGRIALAVTGFLLPMAVPAVLIALAVRWWLRRRGPVPAAEA